MYLQFMYVFIYFNAVGRLDKHKNDARPHCRQKAGSLRIHKAFATRVIMAIIFLYAFSDAQ